MNLTTLVGTYLREGHGEITVVCDNEIVGIIPEDKSNIILKQDCKYTTEQLYNADILSFSSWHKQNSAKRALIAEVRP